MGGGETPPQRQLIQLRALSPRAGRVQVGRIALKGEKKCGPGGEGEGGSREPPRSPSPTGMTSDRAHY